MRRNANETIIASGETVKIALTDAENAIDQAIAKAAALSAVMSTERVRLGVAFQYGQEAMTHGAEGLALLTASRAKIAATHDELGRTGRLLGVPAHALDGLWGKPPAKAELQVVKTEAA